jgi:hypothetical protein
MPPNEEDLRDRVFIQEMVALLNLNHDLTDQVKEVTRMELRHNLTKVQLFQTLISALYHKTWICAKWSTTPCEQLLKAVSAVSLLSYDVCANSSGSL